MKKALEKFQIEGRDFLASRQHALLADQPGLGKTVQAIAAAEKAGLRRNLVVCPASVRTGWLKEINDCLGSSWGWRVISYNEATKLAGKMVGASELENWDAIILDEAHFLKTAESQRTQAIFANDKGLARRAGRRWALTGTPVLNRPRELFPMLKVLCRGFADVTFKQYADRYCGAFFDGYGLNSKGATNLDELSGRLQGFMLRRTKREVFPNRKAPIVSRVPIDLTYVELAAVTAEEDAIGGRETRISSRHEEFSQLGDTSKLLRLLGEAKAKHVVRFVEDQLETVDKIVVFAHHRDVISLLAEKLRVYCPVVYWGGMSDAAKDTARGTFMLDSKCRVFIGQGQAAGTGINGLQTVCSTAVDAEPSWVPGETEQKMDRLDRMGAAGDIVNYYMLYARGTLDAVKLQVHDRKEHIVERVTGDDILRKL